MTTAEVVPRPWLVFDASDPIATGPAEVRNRFDGRWVRGFRVVGAIYGRDGLRYRVARCSDGTVLPATFVPADVRRGR